MPPPCHHCQPSHWHSLSFPEKQVGAICTGSNLSVKLPFLEMILLRGAGSGDPEAQKLYAELRDPGSQRGKPRPCVVLPSVNDDPTPTDICLMATFESGDPTSYPQIFRDFILPVFPHDPDSPTNAKDQCFQPTLHSCPEWSYAPKQWLIAIPVEFDGDRDLTQLESWDANTHFCDETMDVLQEAIEQKRRDWDAKVEVDPEIGSRYYAEMMESERNRPPSMGGRNSYRSKNSRQSKGSKYTYQSQASMETFQSQKSTNSLSLGGKVSKAGATLTRNLFGRKQKQSDTISNQHHPLSASLNRFSALQQITETAEPQLPATPTDSGISLHSRARQQRASPAPQTDPRGRKVSNVVHTRPSSLSTPKRASQQSRMSNIGQATLALGPDPDQSTTLAQQLSGLRIRKKSSFSSLISLRRAPPSPRSATPSVRVPSVRGIPPAQLPVSKDLNGDGWREAIDRRR
ncbi:hypothetical protein C8R47DRAFT_1192474 [Mycena vitilis]|nr:hypothetical protein C8R47DRAFT_1192474 [Mycena vitilis]